jgi:hypothetical protein
MACWRMNSYHVRVVRLRPSGNRCSPITMRTVTCEHGRASLPWIRRYSRPRVLAGQHQVQVDYLWVHRWPQPTWVLAGGPRAAYELAMTPQDRVWTGQECRPAIPGELFDDGRQGHPIAATPPGAAHLSFQHAQLMPQDQNFSLELSLLPIANARQVDKKTDDRGQPLAIVVRANPRLAPLHCSRFPNRVD